MEGQVHAAEVVWVSVQHARGVPSHFNTATPLDERLFQLGGVAIAVPGLRHRGTTG